MQGTTSALRTFKDIDRTLLQAIPNPSGQAYEVKIKIPEFTFPGVKEQPDDDLMAVCEPERLRIVMVCNPRGSMNGNVLM